MLIMHLRVDRLEWELLGGLTPCRLPIATFPSSCVTLRMQAGMFCRREQLFILKVVGGNKSHPGQG